MSWQITMDAYGNTESSNPIFQNTGPLGMGMTQSKQPPQSPPVSNDRSTEADRRLMDLNNGNGGINPGSQTGSSSYDDMRNMRMPVPGGVTIAEDPRGDDRYGLNDGIDYSKLFPIAGAISLFGTVEEKMAFQRMVHEMRYPGSSSLSGRGRVPLTGVSRKVSSPSPDEIDLMNLKMIIEGSSKLQFSGGFLNSAWNAIKGGVGKAWDWLKGTAGKVAGVYGRYWSGVARGVGSFASSMHNTFKAVWNSPAFQYGLDALALATLFTPIPGDEIWGAARLGGRLMNFLGRNKAFQSIANVLGKWAGKIYTPFMRLTGGNPLRGTSLSDGVLKHLLKNPRDWKHNFGSVGDNLAGFADEVWWGFFKGRWQKQVRTRWIGQLPGWPKGVAGSFEWSIDIATMLIMHRKFFP